MSRCHVLLLAAFLIGQITHVSAAESEVHKHTFLIEMFKPQCRADNHQLGMKVKGFDGILTPLAGLLPFKTYNVFDYQGNMLPMIIGTVEPSLGMALLVPDPSAVVFTGAFMKLKEPEYGIALYKTPSGEQPLRVSRTISESLFGKGHKNEMLGVGVTWEQNISDISDLCAVYPSVKKRVEQLTIPADDIRAWSLELLTTSKKVVPMTCLVGSPVYIDGSDPLLAGLVFGQIQGVKEVRVWAVSSAEIFSREGAFKGYPSMSGRLSAIAAIQCEIAKAEKEAERNFVSILPQEPTYTDIDKFSKIDALKEILLRIRVHLPQAAKVEYVRNATIDNRLCCGNKGVGWLDLNKVHEKYDLRTCENVPSVEYPISNLLLYNYSTLFCKQVVVDTKLHVELLRMLVCMHTAMKGIGPDDARLWYETGISIEEISAFVDDRLHFYLKNDFMIKVKRETSTIAMFDDCREVNAFIVEMEEWNLDMDKVKDNELIKQLEEAITLFKDLRLKQLRARFDVLLEGDREYSSLLNKIAADECLSIEERHLLKQWLGEKGIEAPRTDLIGEALEFGDDLSTSLVAQFERLSKNTGLSNYDYAIYVSDSSVVLDFVASSAHDPSGRGKRSKNEVVLATDSVRLKSYAYPLGQFTFRGSEAIFTAVGETIDSVFLDSKSNFYVSYYELIGSADGVPFRTAPFIPNEWVKRASLLGGSNELNSKLAYARGFAAQEILQRAEWAIRVPSKVTGTTTTEVGEQYRNVRLKIQFARNE